MEESETKQRKSFDSVGSGSHIDPCAFYSLKLPKKTMLTEKQDNGFYHKRVKITQTHSLFKVTSSYILFFISKTILQFLKRSFIFLRVIQMLSLDTLWLFRLLCLFLGC